MVRTFFILAFFTCFPSAAWSQQDCFSNFNVKNKIVTIDWIAGVGTGKVMQCEAAEKIRIEVYTKNKEYFNEIGAGNPVAYISTAEKSVSDLKNKIEILESKVKSNDTLASLQISAELVLYEINKAAAIISCIAPEGVFSKLFCAAALASTANDTYKIATGNIAKNDFADIAQRARNELGTARTQLQELKTKLKADSMSVVSRNFSAMFFGYCQSIKRDCL